MTTALVAQPYGRDTSATTRVFYGRMSSGALLVGEAAFRRLSSDWLEYDPTYGYNLANELGADFDAVKLALIPGKIEAQLLLDERIDSVDVDIVQTRGSASNIALEITIDATLDDGTSFTLVLSVNDVTVELLELTAGGGS